MLEKKDFFFADAHFHYSDCIEKNCFIIPDFWIGCSCAHSVEEWNTQYNYYITQKESQKIFCSFGLHPQQASMQTFDLQNNLNLLETLLKENKVNAIGECGFDFFTDEYKNSCELQEQMFKTQLNLAIEYKKPLILHCRKANHKLFEYSNLLSQVPAVLFHSFMGSPVETQSLLTKGINGYFSFGKQILNNNKNVIRCVRELPLTRILLETDSPYQFLKGEKLTSTNDIVRVYEFAWEIRKELDCNLSFEDFSKQMLKNLLSLFHE